MELEAELARRLEARLQRTGVPKYVHLVEIIEEMVTEGALVEGDQLPAETQLSKAMPLSLGTIQKSMSILQSHGIVSREHGRGTFVRSTLPALRGLWHFRFLADDGETILPVYPKVVAVDVVTERGPWSDFLPADEKYVRVERVLNVNEEFNALSTLYVSYKACHGLLTYPVEKLNLYLREVLRDDFGLTTARVVEQVAASKLVERVTGILGLPAGTDGLICHILAYDYRDNPVTFQLIYVPPNTRMLEVRERQP